MVREDNPSKEAASASLPRLHPSIGTSRGDPLITKRSRLPAPTLPMASSIWSGPDPGDWSWT